MVTVNDIEINAVRNDRDLWIATATDYPSFTGAGTTEDEAKESLVNQINAVNTEAGESTEAGSEG